MSSDARDSSSILSICSGLAVSSSLVLLSVIGVLSAIVESGSAVVVAAMASAPQSEAEQLGGWNITQPPCLLCIYRLLLVVLSWLALRLLGCLVCYMPLA